MNFKDKEIAKNNFEYFVEYILYLNFNDNFQYYYNNISSDRIQTITKQISRQSCLTTFISAYGHFLSLNYKSVIIFSKYNKELWYNRNIARDFYKSTGLNLTRNISFHNIGNFDFVLRGRTNCTVLFDECETDNILKCSLYHLEKAIFFS